jgi:hypothetical protein
MEADLTWLDRELIAADLASLPERPAPAGIRRGTWDRLRAADLERISGKELHLLLPLLSEVTRHTMFTDHRYKQPGEKWHGPTPTP